MRLSQYYLPREHWRALIDTLLAVLDPRLAPVWVASVAGGMGPRGGSHRRPPLGLGVLVAGRPERGALLDRHPLSDPATIHAARARARRRPARLDLRSGPCHPPGGGRPARLAPLHAPGMALLPGRDRPPLGPLRRHPQRGAAARGGPVDVGSTPHPLVTARGLGADPEHPRDRPRRVRGGLGLGASPSHGDDGADAPGPGRDHRSWEGWPSPRRRPGTSTRAGSSTRISATTWRAGSSSNSAPGRRGRASPTPGRICLIT